MDPIHQGPPIEFTWPMQATVPVHGFLTPLEVRGAQVMGKHGDLTLATYHDYGKGRVYYFGTYMGLALDKNIPDAHAIVQRIVLQHAKPVLRGDRLRPRLVQGKDRTLLSVFNDHRSETVTEAVVVPAGFRSGKDVVTGQTIPVRDGTITVTVEPEYVTVLLLEKE